MRQWMTLLKKELLEMWRNYKWIWVPISFILLGVQEPLGSYYLPEIIKAAGGLPEGAKIEIPPPKAPEVLMNVMGQFNTLGIVIIILITMSLIAGERKNGTAAMILVKPVSHASFITAKWFGAVLIVWVSLFIGFIASWYYTGLLFDWVEIGKLMGALFLNGLWLTFVLTITIFFSSMFSVPGTAGFAAIASTVIISLFSSSLSHLLEWSPAQLSGYAGEFIVKGRFPDNSIMASVIAIGGIAVLLIFAVFIFRKKELAA